MTVYSWPTGLGQGTGDNLVVDAPVMTTLPTLFVSSVSGSDTNNGVQEDAPLATLAHAISLVAIASSPALIVLMAGHTETITSTLALNQDGLILVGAGASGNTPSVTLTLSGSNRSMLSIEAKGVQVRGIGFAQSLIETNKAIIGAAATARNILIKGCYFEVGEHDFAAIELVNCNGSKLLENTVLSVGTSATARPDFAIRLSEGEGSSPEDTDIIDCIISDGEHCYNNAALTSVATSPRLRIERLSPLLGADISLATSNGLLMTSSTGASSIVWSG
jgi:hypothetical protein